MHCSVTMVFVLGTFFSLFFPSEYGHFHSQILWEHLYFRFACVNVCFEGFCVDIMPFVDQLVCQ